MAGSGVLTLAGITDQINHEYQASAAVLSPIIGVVTVVITLVSSIINRIAFTRRVPEFGLLYASGYSKMWLTNRLTMESGVPAIMGWVMGIGFSWLVLNIINLTVFTPRGHDLNLTSLAPVILTIPVPIAIIGYTLISVSRILSRLDPVTVVERGELSLEEKGGQEYKTTSIKGSPKPLAASTYIYRHRRHAVLQTSAMALMILAVVFVIFALSAADDAQRASLVYLRRVRRIHARPGASLHPSVVTQVKAHPSVEWVIPIGPRYGMLSVFIPPLGEGGNASPFAVYSQDMEYLVGLYDLEVKDGHLPRPNTNEIVIPEVVAQNRKLKVGDVIGDPDQPAYPGASPMPTGFVVSGIFARSIKAEEENWLAFISLEFLENHEAFRLPEGYPLIAVPKDGQKTAMDNWLEDELASDEVWVLTHRHEIARTESRSRSLILTIALVESAIAIVAAITLAVLNYFSVSERQVEFGILNALGYGRLRLVGKTVCETALTIGAAWGLSIILCLIGLLYMQFGVFTSLGLDLNLFNPTPWVFTLPIPIAVLVATSITILRVLSRLDPISIIERRS
jgi:ABC-type lipoprotein release transport system permease subunit